MTPAANRVLLILADDHRDSLEKELYKLTSAPTPEQAARISADKLLVYEALLDVAPQLPENAQAGILVDEQYGAAVAELATNSGGLIDLSMPIEASGHDWFEFAYGDEWQKHAEFFGANHAKILIRDNSGLDAALRLRQAKNVAEISGWARSTGRSLIIELLVPATPADLATVAGDKKRYDDEVRPARTLESIRYLQDHGADPSLWKVEGMDAASDAQAVVDVARRDDRDAECIVLGRHSTRDDLDRWLEVAAPLKGFVGFAIGRSIWWDPLSDLLAGTIDEGDARLAIGASYLDFARFYLAARE